MQYLLGGNMRMLIIVGERAKGTALSLGKFVAARRKALRLTQEDLAELVGVTQPAISQIEVGRNPQPSHAVMYRLAEALRVERRALYEAAGMVELDPRPPPGGGRLPGMDAPDQEGDDAGDFALALAELRRDPEIQAELVWAREELTAEQYDEFERDLAAMWKANLIGSVRHMRRARRPRPERNGALA